MGVYICVCTCTVHTCILAVGILYVHVAQYEGVHVCICLGRRLAQCGGVWNCVFVLADDYIHVHVAQCGGV